jgi:MFS family permease
VKRIHSLEHTRILSSDLKPLFKQFGPTRWLTFQIFAWGLVATFQAFATTYAGYIVTRILLGLCEAGFIPGALYTISTWYKKSEMNLRISIYFFGILLAGATASLIGAGIITMAGRDGISGWRWLFISTSIYRDTGRMLVPDKERYLIQLRELSQSASEYFSCCYFRPVLAMGNH